MATSDEPTNWQRSCRAFVTSAKLDPRSLDLLGAFADTKDHAHPRLDAGGLDFAVVERRAEELAPSLGDRIVSCLADELPPSRCRHYQRRFAALLAGLGALAPAEARVLRVGLVARMAEILERPHRRRSRVRDVIDFYFCHGSVLRHREPGLPSVGERARRLDWRPLAPGLAHACIDARCQEGPVHANLLRIRAHRFSPLLVREPEVDLWGLARRHGARFGTSSGYILGSEMDLEAPSVFGDPVGLLVDEGEVLSPPVFPRTALVHGPGGVDIRRVGPVGFEVSIADWRARVGACNDGSALGATVVAFNRCWGPRSPAGAGPSIAILARRVLAVGSGSLPIPKAGLVLSLPANMTTLPLERAIDSRVDFHGPVEITAAAAAGPRLIEDGRIAIDLEAEWFTPEVPPYTFSADETRGQNLLPRMVVGLTADGELILAAIDGRNFSRAVGMTLDQCATLLQALGCREGMNLDGGDSKRMAIDGRVVDLPGCELEWDPDERTNIEAPIRPVHSALLWFPD